MLGVWGDGGGGGVRYTHTHTHVGMLTCLGGGGGVSECVCGGGVRARGAWGTWVVAGLQGWPALGAGGGYWSSTQHAASSYHVV